MVSGLCKFIGGTLIFLAVVGIVLYGIGGGILGSRTGSGYAGASGSIAGGMLGAGTSGIAAIFALSGVILVGAVFLALGKYLSPAPASFRSRRRYRH